MYIPTPHLLHVYSDSRQSPFSKIQISIYQKKALCRMLTVVRCEHHWSGGCSQFLIFPIQISKEQKWKTTGTRADYFWTTHNFLQRATIVTSFDVHWSLVAQAIPETKLLLSKFSIFQNCYYMLGKILPCDINLNLLLSIHSSYLPLLWSVVPMH